jgi:8-oxo-dGTP pyrophosphatase MutT (NUDIX family)
MPNHHGTPATLAHSRGLVQSADRRHRNMHPRDAACLIVLDTDNPSQPRVLMGQRRPDLAFMPNRLVFPGGRVEASDYLAVRRGVMADPVLTKLMAHTPVNKRAHRQRGLALAHAALRETEEETGLQISTARPGLSALKGGPDFGAWSFLARAITPPRHARRFDTRFFTVSSKRISGQSPIVDGEFVSVHWLTLDEARRQGAAAITKIIMEDLELRLEAGALDDHRAPVPFYFMRGACFHRIML